MSSPTLNTRLDLYERYRLRPIHLLGIGGTSEVTLVEVQGGERYALKRLLGQYRSQREWRDSILLEGVHLSMVRSNRVIRCHQVLTVPIPESLIKISVDEDPSAQPLSARQEVALLMDYISGVHLRAILKVAQRHTLPFSHDEIASMIWDIFRGLKALHRVKRGKSKPCPIAHGDLSPTNIMIREDGSAILIDLSSASSVLSSDNLLRRPGKLAYLSPGQQRGEEEGVEGDLYALACIWIELVTGSLLKVDHKSISWRQFHEAGWPIQWAKIVYGLLSPFPQVRAKMIVYLTREALWGGSRDEHSLRQKHARSSLRHRVKASLKSRED